MVRDLQSLNWPQSSVEVRRGGEGRGGEGREGKGREGKGREGKSYVHDITAWWTPYSMFFYLSFQAKTKYI